MPKPSTASVLKVIILQVGAGAKLELQRRRHRSPSGLARHVCCRPDRGGAKEDKIVL